MNETIEEKINKSWVKEYLSKPNLARLATSNPHNLQPHVVPVWYEWDGECLWISSFRSTRKIKEIIINPKISVVIDTSDDQSTQGVIFEGEAELISDPMIARERASRVYTRYLGEVGVLEAEPQSWMNDPEHLIIKLKPAWVHIWGNSA